MLQIISGRFFGDGLVHESESDAVLYSNMEWLAPIDTAVAQLRPAGGSGHAVSAYVLRYTNRYESGPGDRMVLGNADEAVDQFRLLASFWFRAFFHTDRQHVELLCRSGPRDAHDATIPRSFVPLYFDPGRTMTATEAAGFGVFVAKVLAMPRKDYRLFVACLAAFFDALEAMGTNFDLAYGMMVYLLEALGQGRDGYVPVWEDYDQKVRGRLEEVFSRISPGDADAVRGALLESAHLKLMKRFVGFVADHVADEFFAAQAEGRTQALPKSDLEQSLRNLYNARSGFVHQLSRIREQLRVPVLSRGRDVFVWRNEPHLTFPGLVRLVHHVLSTFACRRPTLEREDFSGWRDELPGSLEVELAPELWIWRAEGFEPRDARRRFSCFAAHAIDLFASPEREMANLTALMEKIEKVAGMSGKGDRPAMLALYWLYHLMVADDHRPGWEAFLSRHEADLEACSVEILAVLTLMPGVPVRWPVAECVAAFDEYRKKRYKPAATRLPVPFEVAVMAIIANLYLEAGDRDAFAAWIDRAILDAAGRKIVQENLAAARAAFAAVETHRLVGLPAGLVEPNDAGEPAAAEGESEA